MDDGREEIIIEKTDTKDTGIATFPYWRTDSGSSSKKRNLEIRLDSYKLKLYPSCRGHCAEE